MLFGGFGLNYGGSIGRITTAGVVTNYTGTGIDSPWDITTGPDGAMWFTNHGNNSIGRITTAGVVSNYTGTGIDGPAGITTGPDGAMWFTNYDNGSIGRITVP
jgi:virginiamycin B lyase